jgi:hypothetical protein
VAEARAERGEALPTQLALVELKSLELVSKLGHDRAERPEARHRYTALDRAHRLPRNAEVGGELPLRQQRDTANAPEAHGDARSTVSNARHRPEASSRLL